ncbi:unnamed protein product [Owenia fusiformis]|uniref:Uncharacterized protein n=1 Tax=Owenia fusiformis TaxID=6347 RepID=A0A8J1Y4D9_OWEFU|nr:unnamed protein product [Owenia fusiformis]
MLTMGYLYRVVFLMTVVSLRYIYVDGLLCPVGYRLVKDALVDSVVSKNLTWTEAVMACTKRNGTIIDIRDNQSKKIVFNVMERFKLGSAWIGHSGDIVEATNPSEIRKPYFIMEYIDDEQFEASSYYFYNLYLPELARFNSESAWVPQYDRQDQWIQVDLEATMCIYGIVTQGRKNPSWRTTAYKLLYRKDGDNFHTLQDNGEEEFPGNRNAVTPVARNFTKPFDAQFIRIYPQDWIIHPAIRFDLLVSKETCPIDFTCGKCPALVNTSQRDLAIQYESCCSKLPYICQTESCELTTESQSSLTDSAILNASTNPHKGTPPSSSSTVGLAIGMVLFMIISVILLILLVFLYRHLNNLRTTTDAEKTDHNENNKKEIQQSDTMVTPNLHDKTELNINNIEYFAIDTKDNVEQDTTVYEAINTDLDHTENGEYEYIEEKKDDGNEILGNNMETPYITLTDEGVYSEEKKVVENEVQENGAKEPTLHDSPEAVDAYDDEKVDDSEIPDGTDMLNNEIYSDN